MQAQSILLALDLVTFEVEQRPVIELQTLTGRPAGQSRMAITNSDVPFGTVYQILMNPAIPISLPIHR